MKHKRIITNLLAIALFLLMALPPLAIPQVTNVSLARPDPEVTPMPTNTPKVTCGVNEFRPQLSVEEEAKVRTAVQIELDVLRATQRLQSYWSIESVWGQGNWAVVECDVRTEDNSPVATEGRVVLARKTDNTWTIAMPGSQEYEVWLYEVPQSYLAPEAKKFLAKWRIVRAKSVATQGNRLHRE